MKRSLFIWLAVALGAAVLAHLAWIAVYPRLVMSKAMERLSNDGEQVNVWQHAPRMTEDVRIIVRPSPDLAYSSCVFDLAEGPVRIHVEPWQDYMSLSLFGANTDNFYTLNDRRMPVSGADVILKRRGQTVSPAWSAAAIEVIESPSVRGIALIRRLAPTPERFALAAAARGAERCERLTGVPE